MQGEQNNSKCEKIEEKLNQSFIFFKRLKEKSKE